MQREQVRVLHFGQVIEGVWYRFGGRKREHVGEEQYFGRGVESSRRRLLYLWVKDGDRYWGMGESLVETGMPQHLKAVRDL